MQMHIEGGCPPGTVGEAISTTQGNYFECVVVVSPPPVPAWYEQYERSWAHFALAVGLVLYIMLLAILRSASELPAIQMPELVEYGRYDVHEKSDDDDE